MAFKNEAQDKSQRISKNLKKSQKIVNEEPDVVRILPPPMLLMLFMLLNTPLDPPNPPSGAAPRNEPFTTITPVFIAVLIRALSYY